MPYFQYLSACSVQGGNHGFVFGDEFVADFRGVWGCFQARSELALITKLMYQDTLCQPMT